MIYIEVRFNFTYILRLERGVDEVTSFKLSYKTWLWNIVHLFDWKLILKVIVICICCSNVKELLWW